MRSYCPVGPVTLGFGSERAGATGVECPAPTRIPEDPCFGCAAVSSTRRQDDEMCG